MNPMSAGAALVSRDGDRALLDSVARDRLQPVLLDRLTDLQPLERAERAGTFLMSGRMLRDSVLRDLQWLLNTTNFGGAHPIAQMNRARASVLNYGVQAWAGTRMSDVDLLDVESAVRTAIVNFEPRIVPDTLEVRCLAQRDALEHHNLLALEIRGTLWSVPYPVEFILRSELDLESGYMMVQPVGGL